jgi:type I restriction enzyme S subunit
MNSEWKTVAIGDICEVYDGPHATPEKTDAGPVFLGISSLNSGRIDLERSDHISEEDFAQWTRRVVPTKGDIVFSYETRLGEAGLIPEGLRCCLGRRMGLLRIKDKTRVDPKFLLYNYLGPAYQALISERTVFGSTVERIPLKDVHGFPMCVPPIADQQAIAHILGTLDEKIELNRKTNETLEAMARAVFKSWFIDFDPVRSKLEGRPTGLPDEISDLFPDSFEDSELGEIPKGWEVKALDQVAHFLNGLALQKFPPEDGGPTLPVIKIAQLKKGDALGADRCSTSVPDDYVIRDGDVLFSWSGSLAVDIWCGGDGALNQHLFKVTSKTYCKWFFYQWVKHHLPDFQEIAQSKATTMGHIQRHHLSEAQALIPTPSLLGAMDSVFASMLDRSFVLRKQSRELSCIRDTLLPKLISGELRIPDAERLLEEAGV